MPVSTFPVPKRPGRGRHTQIPQTLVITPEERAVLRQILNAPTSPQHVWRQARVLLALVEDPAVSVVQLAKDLGTARVCVYKIVRGWQQQGMASVVGTLPQARQTRLRRQVRMGGQAVRRSA